MNEMDSLVIFTRAESMLAEADTIQKAKEFKSLALTAADWARRKGMGERAIRHCRSYAMRAEIKMGEMLALKPHPGQEAFVPDKGSVGNTVAPTLADLGVSKRESAEAQKLAELPSEVKEQVIAGDKTRKEAMRERRKFEHEKTIQNPAEPINGPFEIILADPPWRYQVAESPNRQIENQYPTATLEEIKAHKPDSETESVLFLWATAPLIPEALQVMNAWGFLYRTCAVWDKEIIGMGYWFRGQHELLLVGTKGSFSPPAEFLRVSSIFRERRIGHSIKPQCVYEWIERTWPQLSKLEMYARNARKSWMSWGNEVNA